jgi:hypothetical protein
MKTKKIDKDIRDSAEVIKQALLTYSDKIINNIGVVTAIINKHDNDLYIPFELVLELPDGSKLELVIRALNNKISIVIESNDYADIFYTDKPIVYNISHPDISVVLYGLALMMAREMKDDIRKYIKERGMRWV